MPPPVTLASLRERFRASAQPVVIYNKSHSGSRLLAEVLETAGIFMGAEQNESRDAAVLLDLVMALVCDYYPDYRGRWPQLWTDARIGALAETVFAWHLRGCAPESGQPWGWKLCETTYAVPVFAALFPGARFIHLVRDGRDVACCNHRGPDSPFWRKVYFDTDRTTLRSLSLPARLYRLRPHVYNAVHWTSSVRVGREYALALGDRCLEVRYEDFCLSFEKTVERVLHFVGFGDSRAVVNLLQPKVHTDSVGKYRALSPQKLRAVLGVAGPMLGELGYLPPTS